MKHLVFVYGTLRPSLRRVYDKWPWLPFGDEKGKGTIKAQLFGLTLTVPGVKLGGDTNVVGEVVQVDAEGLRGFDRLEGHPRNYKRELVEITMDGGSKLQAFCYVFQHIDLDRHTLIPSGDWEPIYLDAVKVWK